jgi:predicted CXXCH cytochrome family protein
LTGQLREPVRLARADVHAGIGCTGCHGGDGSAKTGREAHAKGFDSGALDSAGIAALCGRCHKEPAANYLKGPHQLTASAPRRPDCTTCHGAHGVQKASVTLIAEPLCSSCHTVAQARRIGKALGDAEREVSALDAQLASTGNHAAERAQLKEARSQLRGLAHALDLFTITRTAANTLSLVDEVRAKALPKEGAKDWGRRLRIAGIAFAAAMLLVAALWGLRWLRARKLKLPIPRGREMVLLASAGGVLLIALAIGAWRGRQYMDHDPKFCTSCHTMNSAYALWGQSAHNKIECHTCHEPDVASNLHQLWVYATRKPDEVVKHAQVDRAVCEQCHTTGANASKWNRIQETPGHRVHVGKERVECTQCHAMSVHRFKPPKELCVTCHKKVTLAAAGTMAEMHCLQCHPFMAQDAKRPLKPDRAACMECHELRQIKGEIFPAKAPMRWDCGRCHKPHEKMYLGREDCLKCHDTMTEGIHRVKSHNNCVSCHKPHGWNTTPAACTSCHASVSVDKHHATRGKTCKDCHGVWDDEFLPKPKLAKK